VQIVQPSLMALLPNPPPVDASDVRRAGPLDLSVGNLQVTADPTTGFITATRLSDNAVLLTQNGLTWGQAARTFLFSRCLSTYTTVPLSAAGSRANSVSALVTFAGAGNSQRIVRR
jgi:hypothetical protein